MLSYSLERSFFLTDDRVALRIDPLGVLRWHVTAQAVYLEIGRNIFVWIIDAEETPTPATAPVWVVREPVLGVFDHHEPLGNRTVPVNVASAHFTFLTRSDFLDDRCA